MNTINLDLKTIKILWTTCEKSKNRHEPMKLMLNSLGLSAEMVAGPITDPYTVGVAIGYKEALNKFDPPFLILEDDACLSNLNFDYNLQIPLNCDAFYMGTSTYGRINKKTINNAVIAANVDDKQIKIFNMLSFHAVVYLTKKYVNHVSKIMEDFIINPIGGCDDPIAETMWNWNVYATKNPIFYQNDGHSNLATKSIINALL